MTQPLRTLDRTRLMLGCGSAALALALALGPQSAAAQGIQATPTLVSGTANVTSPAANTTQIDVATQTAVIDWTPQVDNNGNALSFLPTGSTALFRGTDPTFAVLNRILPTTNNNIAVIDGSVISQIGNPSTGFTTGGFIAFYSPTGILIGPNASFDVGKLMLTTLDTTPASFDNFANGGFLSLQGQQGSTATITVSPGAQINATQENSFFAIVAADIEMRGRALVNGSHAYVAGEVVNMRFSNGLFDISIPTGTAASGEVVTLNGTIGGPSSNGVGDDHMIYAVARASQDPISMLLSGNIGFTPAQSAGIVNGEIILAANYNVFGRSVGGGAIGQDVDTVQFRRANATSDVRADITLQDFNASSSVLAIGTGRTLATSLNANSSVAGNLMLVGRQSAALAVTGPRSFAVSGDVLVDSRDFGVVGSGLQSLDVLNAQGGTAQILTRNPNAVVTIGGRAIVTADAIGGAETSSRIAGTARGGTAEIVITGGRVSVTGNTSVRAGAFGTASGVNTGAEARGGTARLAVTNGGQAALSGDLIVLANATGAEGSQFGPATVSNAYGGQALVTLSDPNGTITVGGDVLLDASATGGSSNNAGLGSLGDAGVATATVTGPGTFDVTGRLRLFAAGFGGDNVGGTGGTGLGGRASIATLTGGTIIARNEFVAAADGFGGGGQIGGDGFGGIAGANAIVGLIDIANRAFAHSYGYGGDARFGVGGNGGLGQGGYAFLQAQGTLTEIARFSIGGDATVAVDGYGGRGGNGNDTLPGGRGGDGVGGRPSIVNQADPAFGGGAFLLAGADNGILEVAGNSDLLAFGDAGRGGDGGDGTGTNGGRGGDGIGGYAEAGLALFGLNGSVGAGRANFTGQLRVLVDGYGGDGGDADAPPLRGNGGIGKGGDALLTVLAGGVTVSQALLTAYGYGGFGATGGEGQGGVAKVFGGLGGVLNASGLEILAQGFGGFAFAGRGGDGFGGTAGFEIDGISANIDGDVSIDASGSGANSADGVSGDGSGGEAYISSATVPGTLDVTGHTSVFANGYGAESLGAFAAGNGQGGLAYIDALGGSTMSFNTAQVAALGRGGEAAQHEGGNGTGGIVRLLASGAGSRISIDRNVSRAIASESPAGDALLNADGIGQATFDGDGIGGVGRGGSVSMIVRSGGNIALPNAPLLDPQSVGVISIRASGTGGGSAAEGGIGGIGAGGDVNIEVDGQASRLSIGDTNFTVFSQGGSALDASRNITGGAAFGGRRIIRVLNGGSLGLGPFGGQSGASGGDGAGSGNGGNAVSGRNFVELNGGTLNVTGAFAMLDQTTGGSGLRGGDVTALGEGGAVEFSATNSTVNFTPDGQGRSALTLESIANGGTGVAAGGNAQGTAVSLSLINTDLTDASLRVTTLAEGGRATGTDGVGGNALTGNVGVIVRESALSMTDEIVIFANARGGAGAIQGGTASSGEARVALENSTIAVRALNTARAIMQVQSFAVGGNGNQAGDATSRLARLEMTNAAIRAGELTIESGAAALSQTAGGIGGTARADRAQVAIQGGSLIDAATFGLFSNANTTGAGSAIGGVSSLTVAPGSQTQITTNRMSMVSDGVGSTAANGNVAGQFDITVASGSINAGALFASARGNQVSGVRSQIIADGGSLNVSGAFDALTFGDILLRTGQGGVIGNVAATANTTAIRVTSDGTIQTVGDGSTGSGLGGQSISLLAGRSILLGGAMTGRGGPITLTANRGGGQALSPAPASVITMAQGSRIDAGAGTVTMRLLDGGSDPQRAGGAITLANIAASRIDVRNLVSTAGSNISILAGSVLTASGSGRAIDLASLGGEVINLAGDAGLVLTGGGHYGIFAATPTGSQIGSFANYARRYNVANAAAYDALNPGGNFAAFRIVPFLTVTPAAASRFYGNANPTFTASFTGFLPGDGIGGLTGTAQFTTLANGTSNIGQYAVGAALGSLLSAQGYQFTFAPGVLNVTPRPLTVTANNLSRLYGNANPALTFTVGGLGLVNGDQLAGALSTTAGVTTGVGNVAITQGTLAASANYALTFVAGQLAITPRLLTVTADNLSKLLGNADPAFTFRLTGDGLVDGDRISGSLVRDAGERVGVFAIRQGTLSAGSNYAITYVGAELTINSPPAPPGINNPTTFEPPITIGDQKPPVGDEDEKRFGIDFPESLEAPLISEDPLLDDPVTSGGDAAVYGDAVPPTGGGK